MTRQQKITAAPTGLIIWVICVLNALISNTSFAQNSGSSGGEDPMLRRLIDRVVAEPGHSDSWRLLGKLFRKKGNPEKARECLDNAIKADPKNAAAHFDMGEFAQEQGDIDIANQHFAEVFRIAPASEYASRLKKAGIEPPADAGQKSTSDLPPVALADFARLSSSLRESGEIGLVGYESKTFDSADEVDRRMTQAQRSVSPKNIQGSIESGFLYNSNVTLAPISRFISNVDAASAQFFANPSFEWTAGRKDWGRFGPIARGQFTVNENQFSAFNLASFQPGGFFEKDISNGPDQRLARLEYTYNLDFFGGDRLGDRHTLIGSIMSIRPSSSIDYFYTSVAYSQFTDDGATPDTDSLDGTTWSTGAARFFLFDNALVPTMTLGTDIESADTEGSNFRYYSIRAYVDSTFILPYKLTFIPSAAIGYRHFPDFAGTVNRDVLTGRLGAKLRRQLGKNTSISGVINYDRFASDNVLFDADRFTTGIVFTYTY